ncbi:type II toxin-antitoxin system HicA family toxin [Endothiovibrio diazotrophicus]
MGIRDKILTKMRNNPRDWRIEDLKSIARHHGVDWRNEGGSHHVFSFPGVEEDLCVPAHRPIKPVYVRRFVALIDKVEKLRS